MGIYYMLDNLSETEENNVTVWLREKYTKEIEHIHKYMHIHRLMIYIGRQVTNIEY
jgi:hypothetical protein